MTHTFLGPTMTLEGEVTGADPMTIQGQIKGQIRVSSAVRVEANSAIEATLEAEQIHIAGSVTGDISASERVELAHSSQVIGDVRAPRILIADGASFKGHIDMDV